MLSAVAEASEIGLPRCWAVTSLFTLLGSAEQARLRLSSLASARSVAAALCEAVELCNAQTMRSATAAALGLALLCRGDDELVTAMVEETKGLSPRQIDNFDYHSEEEPSSDEMTEEEDTTDEDEEEQEQPWAPVVTSKSGVRALLGLLSSRRKSGKKELDWSSTGAACRALSVCAAHSVQHRKNMGEMDKGDLLKRLVKTAAEAERATENERAMMRAQSRPRMDDGGKAPPPVQQSVGLASLLLWSVSAIASLAMDCVENQLALVLISSSTAGKDAAQSEDSGLVGMLGGVLASASAEVFPAPSTLVEQAALAVAALGQNVDETKIHVMMENIAPVLVSLLELASAQPPSTRAAAAQTIGALSRNATAHKMIFIQLGAVPGLVRCVQGPRSDGEALKLAAGAALQCIAVNNPSGMRAISRDGGKAALRLTQRLARAQQQQKQQKQLRRQQEQAGAERASGPAGYGGVPQVADAPPAPRRVTWDDLDGPGTAGVTARAARKAMAFEDAPSSDKPSNLSAPFPNRASGVPAPTQSLELVTANDGGRVAHGRRSGSAGLWPAAAAAASASPRVAPSRRPPEPKVGWRTQLAGGPKVQAGSAKDAKKPRVVAKMGGEPRWISGRRGFVRGEVRGRRRRWISTENLHYSNGGGQPDNLFRGNY